MLPLMLHFSMKQNTVTTHTATDPRERLYLLESEGTYGACPSSAPTISSIVLSYGDSKLILIVVTQSLGSTRILWVADIIKTTSYLIKE